jgi:hypothetical protein
VETVADDIVQTVLENPGAEDTALYALDDDGNLIAMDDDQGVGKASKLIGVFDRVVVGSRNSLEGLTTLVVNDTSTDTDGDGLGSALETAICTCDEQWIWVCNRWCTVLNAQDTDWDGLWDDWEVLGIDDASSPQHLPMWGADPGRKDLFMEIDRCREAGHTAPIMSESQLGEVRDVYKGLTTVVNWDGSTGIYLHFDRGQSCTDVKLCGDWGGGGTITPEHANCHDWARSNYSRTATTGPEATTRSSSPR